MAPARSIPGTVLLALAIGAALAACKGGTDAPDAGPDTPVVIHPDFGPQDPGPPDPGTPRDTPTDPGKDAKDTGVRDPGEDPGDDPGVDDPGFDPGDFDPGAEDPGSSDPGCTTTCESKGWVCGTVCGKSCGPECKTKGTAWSCVAGQCQCTAACGSRNCGDDGCGGSCGTCPGGAACLASGKCESTGPCTKTNSITCANQSADAYNGSPGSESNVLDSWPAACDSAKTPGPEKVFAFYADQSGTVTFTLTGQQSWLDLYLIEGGTCGTAGCTQHSHDTVSLNAVQGTIYWVVVDASVVDARTGPSLAIDCSWYTPTTDP